MSDEQPKGRRTIEVGSTGRTVAVNLLRLRNARNLTTRQLSAALERAGRPIPPSGITRMEKAERVVTADDLAALAGVFGVSPSALLLPLDDSPETTVEITGGGTVPANVAWDWVDGVRPLRVSDRDPGAARLEFELYGRPPGRRGRLPRTGGTADVVDLNEWLREIGFPIDEWLRRQGFIEPPDGG